MLMMVRLFQNSKLKRFILILLVVMIFTSTFTSLFGQKVYADSNHLRETYIELMSGAKAVNVTDIESLTVNDLRCIALFMSNFYIPYNTSLDNTEAEDTNKQYMINTLKNIGFDNESAETLINATYSASLSSAKKLYIKADDINYDLIGIGEKFDDPGVAPDNSNGDYLNFVGQPIVCGGSTYYPLTLWFYTCFLNCISKEGGVVDFVFYWGDESGMTPAFHLNTQTATLISAFSKHIDISNGTGGNALLNTSASSWNTMSNTERASASVFTQNMYVDWVGNIICDFGDSRVIMYPACINTCVFSSIEADDITPSTVNLISTWGQWFLNNHMEVSSTNNGFEVKSDSVGYYPVDFYLVRNDSSQIATWKKNDWGGVKGLGSVAETFFEELGVTTGAGLFDSAKWERTTLTDDSIGYSGEGQLFYPMYNLLFSDTTSINEYLVYKSVTNSTIENLTSGSAFVTASVLDDGVGAYFTSESKFKTKSDDFSSFMQFDKSDYAMLTNYFLTYAFAYNNRGKTAWDKDCYVHFKFNAKNFPESLDTSIVWNSINTDEEKIISFIYYLLHPVEGVKYVTTLFKNKISGIFVGWHEDVVGGTDSNSTTGMTQYLNFTGYVTSPSLSEISWISELLYRYNNIIVFLIIFMAVILLCYILIGTINIQRALVGLILFALLAFLPPVAINIVTNSINKICDDIYSDKFDYWAYTQLYTYMDKLSSVNVASNVTDYVAALMDLQNSTIADSQNGYSGVKLKWMTPKKFNELAKASDELASGLNDSFSGAMISILTKSIGSTHSTEEYTDAVGATYLYRDFSDIYKYASTSYNVFTGGNDILNYSQLCLGATSSDGSSMVRSHWLKHNDKNQAGQIQYSSGAPLADYVMANDEISDDYSSIPSCIRDTSSLNAVRRGFLWDSVSLKDKSRGNYYTQDGGLATGLLLGYNDYLGYVHKNLQNLKDKMDNGTIDITSGNIVSGDSVFGLDFDAFDYSLNDFISDRDEAISDVDEARDNLSGYYYALYAESPFYFFNNNFRDHLSTYEFSNYSYNYDALGSSSGNVTNLMTSRDQEYFYNLTDSAGDGYGELRDFTNMHDMFYYIIPALDEGCKLADQFDSVFGMYVNDDLSLSITASGKVHYNGVDTTLEELRDNGTFENMTEEELYKFWHDYNVWTIFNAYVPWIDTMEDCYYAKPESIEVLGEKFLVLNPLDPTSYFHMNDNGEMDAGRYMIFSRSEMEYYGLDITDLTEVERKIINYQDNVYEKTLDLVNYYTLSDEVLIQAYSMIQLFEFNKEFSQSGIFGKSYMLYPLGYEAKAFTYDAYLRLVISEASGEPIQVLSTTGETSIYRRVLEKTSLFFGIFLLINDVLSVYIIPCLKIAFLIMMFFVSISLIVAASVKMELNIITVFWKSILFPILSYFAVSVGFAWLVSLFMSNGASGVTKTSMTISVGDPTTVIIIMIVINIAVMILYFRICKQCFKDLKTYALSVLDSISATVIGAAKRLGGLALMTGASRRYGTANNMAAGIASSARQRGRDFSRSNSIGGVGFGSGLVAGGMGMKTVIDRQTHSNNTAVNQAPRVNKYDARVMGDQAELNAINAKVKKSKYDKAVEAQGKAADKASAGRAVMLDNSRGLRNRAAGAKAYVTGSISERVHKTTGNMYRGAHNITNKATGGRLEQLQNTVLGTKENRGLTNAEIDRRNQLSRSQLSRDQLRPKKGADTQLKPTKDKKGKELSPQVGRNQLRSRIGNTKQRPMTTGSGRDFSAQRTRPAKV